MDAVKFGRYRLFELVGQGAMSKVYKARDTVMGRDVAIKLLSAELANEPGLPERFNREALTVGRLTEPHIIPIHDTGEIDGQLYLVMPIIDGINISTAIKQDGPMAPERAVRVIEQIAAALNVAHAHGLVHRDVKPSNALITHDDFVYLIDFGLVHDKAATELTTAGQIVGTYAYMAPERLMTPDIADARADVYALACMLHELLTGARPFPGTLVAQQMTAHLTLDPPVPSAQQPGVPIGFDDVVARGMAKDADERYQSAAELAAAARAALTTPLREQTADASNTSRVGTPSAVPAEQTYPMGPPTEPPTTPTGIGGVPLPGMRAASFPWPPVSEPDRSPYRGWDPFLPIDAGVFFGRDAELMRAMSALRGMREGDETLFVVLGASGSGKSCFLRAGLVPRLQKDDRSYLVLDIVRPELKVLTGASGLAQSICAARQRFGLTDPPLGEIKDACTRGDRARLRTWLAECLEAAAAQSVGATSDEDPLTIVLPLDQAEELFTGGAGAEAAEALALIHDLAAGTDDQEALRLIVVATIRTDRYELMQTAPQLTGLHTQQFDLRPMDATQFNSVIAGPAQRSTDGGHPLYLDEELVRQLLADASGGGDTLPLLSLTLAWLYRDYGSTGRLTLEPYVERGGIDSVVQAEIDEVLAADPDERATELELLRTAFIPWLATIHPDNNQPMRRLAHWNDLPAETRPLLERFVTRRLLIKDQRDGAVVVEVALESLLRQWDDLAAWLAEEREDLKAADALERSAAEWDQKDRDDAWLLHGTRLSDAENLSAKTGFGDRLNPTRDYLLASRQRETQRQQAELDTANRLAATEIQAREQAQQSAAELRRRSRILRAVLVGTAIVAVIAVVGAIAAVVMYNRANRQARNELAAELDTEAAAVFSRVTADGDIDAVADTLAALRLRSDPRASVAALYTATTELNTTRMMIPALAPVGAVAQSPDGRILAAGNTDGTIQLWDLTDGAHPSPLGQPLRGHNERVRGVAFSPDGHTLASGGADHAVQLWNLTDPAHPSPVGQPLRGHSADVVSVAFSPDGRTLASGSVDNTARLWNLTEPAHPGPLGEPLQGHRGEVMSVAFSPDGHTLAAGCGDHAVQLWDLADLAHPGAPLETPSGEVMSVAFSPDGHTLASGGGDQTVRLWNLADPAHPDPLGQPLTGHAAPVRSVAFSPDGRTLASGGSDEAVRLWNLTDPAHPGPLGKPLTGHTGPVRSVAFSPDGHTLASGSIDATVRLWNLDTAIPLLGHTNFVQSVAFSRDGHTLASGSADHTVRLWDLSNPARPIPLGQPLIGHTGGVWSVAFSRDGHTLASGGVDRHHPAVGSQRPGAPNSLGATAYRSYRRRVECGVQPRRAHPGVRRRRPQHPVVESHRPGAPTPPRRSHRRRTHRRVQPRRSHARLRQQRQHRAAVESHRSGPPEPAG